MIAAGKWNVNEIVSFNRMPVTMLALTSDPVMVKILLNGKADVNPKGCVSVLQTACKEFNPESVKILLDAKANVNHADSTGETALYYAVYTKCDPERVSDQTAVLNLLLDAGADTRRAIGGNSIMHMPMVIRQEAFTMEDNVSSMHTAFPTLLARDPGLLDCRDVDGLTPLMAMARNEQKPLSAVKALIAAGADVSALDNHGRSALFHLFFSKCDFSSRRSVYDVMLQLLDSDPYGCDKNGATILMKFVAISESEDGYSENRAMHYIRRVLDAIAARCAATDLESTNS
jgi:ankyrin repeat protein